MTSYLELGPCLVSQNIFALFISIDDRFVVNHFIPVITVLSNRLRSFFIVKNCVKISLRFWP